MANNGDRTPDLPLNADVFVFGDSLTVGLGPHLSGYTVDAQNDRKGADTLQGLSGEDLAKYDAVVIWLGTNDDSVLNFSHALTVFLDRNMKDFKGPILLAKVHASVSKKPAGINTALTDAASGKSNVHVIEMATIANKYTLSDGVHLTAEGYKECAKFLKKSVMSHPISSVDIQPSSGDDSSPSGSFELAKKFIKPNRLKEGVIFNPPQPHKKLFRLSEYPNPRGFIVRDPAVQANFGSGGKWQTFQSNFGFRFSYNPTTFSESYSAPTNGDPVQILVDSAKGRPLLTGDGSGGQVTFNLLLSRFEDQWYLKQSNWADFYPTGSITPEQRIDILERGTQSDIEYLFRLCNGDPQDTWHGMTSDWGMLIPMPSIISFGDQKGVRRVRGYIVSVGWSHKILAAGMIPMYSEVSVVFNRLPDSYYDTTGGTSGPAVNSSNQHYDGNGRKTDGKTTKADIGPVMATARDMAGKYSRGTMVGPDPDPAKGIDDAGYVWHVFDFAIPNSAGAQYNGRSALMKLGKTVDLQHMQEGDVVFFGRGKDPSTASHVGILSGDGMILHVSDDKNIKQPVEEPVEDVVTKMKLNKQPMVVRRFVESN